MKPSRLRSLTALAVLLFAANAVSVWAAPPITTGLFLNLQGDNASNFTFSDGVFISSWLDQATDAGSQDYTQSNAARQPTMVNVAMPNGSLRNVVDFVRNTPSNNTNNSTTNSDRLFNAGGSAYDSATGWSVFTVFQNRLGAQPTVSARQRAAVFQNRSIAGGDVYSVSMSETNLVGPDTLIPDLYVAQRDSMFNGSSNQEIVGDIRTDIWYATGTSWDFVSGVATTRYLYSNGTVTNTTQNGGIWASGLTGIIDQSGIGAYNPTSNNTAAAFDGQIAEILNYNVPLSAADFDATMSYLNQKYFLAAPPPHEGDFDLDGDVDGADFVAWQTNFPKATGAIRAEGDADGDGDVDGADFVVWQTNFPFTPGPGAAPVPEPSAAILAILGGLLLWRRRKSAIIFN